MREPRRSTRNACRFDRERLRPGRERRPGHRERRSPTREPCRIAREPRWSLRERRWTPGNPCRLSGNAAGFGREPCWTMREGRRKGGKRAKTGGNASGRAGKASIWAGNALNSPKTSKNRPQPTFSPPWPWPVYKKRQPEGRGTSFGHPAGPANRAGRPPHS